MSTIPDNQAGARRRRRKHSDGFKANAVPACMRPGISMAAVAMAHGIDSNILRRWVQEVEMTPSAGLVRTTPAPVAKAPASKTLFVPLSLPAPAAPVPMADIRIELQHGAIAVSIAELSPTSPARLMLQVMPWSLSSGWK